MRKRSLLQPLSSCKEIAVTALTNSTSSYRREPRGTELCARASRGLQSVGARRRAELIAHHEQVSVVLRVYPSVGPDG
jgi:hypothetical protein